MAGATREEREPGGTADGRVRVFLRTPLFTTRDHPHLPPGTFVLEGRLGASGPAGGLLVAVERCLDEAGRAMEGGAGTLFLPLAKIDHVSFLDGEERGTP